MGVKIKMCMENQDIDELFTGLFLSFPVFTRRFLRIGSIVISNKEITRSHVSLMRYLKIDGPCKMSDLGIMLYIPNPNVTVLVEKLVEFNMVKRTLDKNDRRVIYIELTKIGGDFLQECTEKMKSAFCKSMQKFNSDDLTLLKETLNNMKILVEKINYDKV